MGSIFDDMRPLSHHGNNIVSDTALRNRFFLAGVMSVAGFQPLTTKWWHYQLPNPENYPLITEDKVPDDTS